ncbi:MAG: DUF6783 domain-containing protein [Blautia faecis]
MCGRFCPEEGAVSALRQPSRFAKYTCKVGRADCAGMLFQAGSSNIIAHNNKGCVNRYATLFSLISSSATFVP